MPIFTFFGIICSLFRNLKYIFDYFAKFWFQQYINMSNSILLTATENWWNLKNFLIFNFCHFIFLNAYLSFFLSNYSYYFYIVIYKVNNVYTYRNLYIIYQEHQYKHIAYRGSLKLDMSIITGSRTTCEIRMLALSNISLEY